MTPSIGLTDLGTQNRRLLQELEAAGRRVLASSRFILGEEVERFESAAAEYLGVPHAIGVSSGTDALLVALTALGLKPGDEVITTPFSFVSSAECVACLGARPRFVDVDPATLCIDASQVELAFRATTRAVLPVHLYGTAAPVDRLAALCESRASALVEDAAQAFGTRAFERRAGALGTFGCFSFFPSKVLGALGDAGLVVTSEPELAERCRGLRQHGRGEAGVYEVLGGNHRLDALQAAFLRVKLSHVDAYVEARRRNGQRYDAAFSGISGLVPVTRNVGWNGAVYSVRVFDGRRDSLRRTLEARGVETAVYYRTPLHLEPVFAGLGYSRGAFPVCERAAEEVLALPVHAELADADVDRVIDEVSRFFR